MTIAQFTSKFSIFSIHEISVLDPPPGSVSHRYGSLAFSHKSIEQTEIMVAKYNFNSKIFLLKIQF